MRGRGGCRNKKLKTELGMRQNLRKDLPYAAKREIGV
jgi:hypothetical protein